MAVPFSTRGQVVFTELIRRSHKSLPNNKPPFVVGIKVTPLKISKISCGCVFNKEL